MAFKRFILLIIISASTLFVVQAQTGTWELGISAGGAGYIGDLNQTNLLKISGLSAGAYVKRNFNPYWGVRMGYNYGQIKADDANSGNEQFRERNLRFKTSLNEINSIVDFNFFDFAPGSGFGRRFTPYIFTGIGIVIFKPSAQYNDTKYRLDHYTTEGQDRPYRNYTLSIPYGAGLRYNYKDSWSIFTEIGYRTAFTDYLDDVSGVYPVHQIVVGNPPNQVNLSDPSLHQTGAPGTQRGDFRKRDTYLFVSVGISFTFVTSKCYSF